MAEAKSEVRTETKSEKTLKKDNDSIAPSLAQSENRMVTVRDLRKNKKRRYSYGTKSFQRATFGVIKSSRRISNAVTEGLDRFYKESTKSSRKKRDGLLGDLLKNSARGFRELSRELGKAPYDLAKRINTRPLTRLFLGR
jgi:hypothetical protein